MEEKLLTPLRDVPLPPSAVDLHRAVRDGRRTVRRRRVGVVAAAGLAVAAVLVAAPAILERQAAPTPATPAVTPTPTAASTAPMPSRAPAAFAPSRQYADFGWLPDGVTDRTVTTRADQLALTAATPVSPAAKDPGLMVDLRMVPAGRGIAVGIERDFATSDSATGAAGAEAAEPVNGRGARWNTVAAPGPGSTALRWEYAPGAWAEVIVQRAPEGSDPRLLARRIAADVRYGVDRPVRLPARLGALPAGLKPISYQVSRRARGGWTVELAYSAGGRTKFGDWPLVVLMMPRASESGDGAVLGDPDSTLDGHPARRRTAMDGGASLQLYDVDGLYVEIAVHDRSTLRAFGGNLDQLYRDATIYPKVADWR